jgi:hypothetical protein
MKLLAPLLFATFATLVQAEPVPGEPVATGPTQAEAVAGPTTQVETFDDRVRIAQDVEDDAQYNNYRSAVLKKNSRHLVRTMRTCIARSPKPAAKAFVLVADITADGKAHAVAVKPDNEVANCFASGFSSVSYPKPPQFPKRDGFPVMMKVRVVR